MTVGVTAGTAGIEVVLVMGTNPNSNRGLSQLFKVLELADEAPVRNKFELVSVVWVVDLVVTINRGPGRPPRGRTARPPGPPAPPTNFVVKPPSPPRPSNSNTFQGTHQPHESLD